MLLTEGQMSDHKGADMLLPVLPPARQLLGDRGYDSNRCRAHTFFSAICIAAAVIS